MWSVGQVERRDTCRIVHFQRRQVSFLDLTYKFDPPVAFRLPWSFFVRIISRYALSRGRQGWEIRRCERRMHSVWACS